MIFFSKDCAGWEGGSWKSKGKVAIFADSLRPKKKARINRAVSWNYQDCTHWQFYDKDTPFINTAKIHFIPFSSKASFVFHRFIFLHS
jgi:hypothetical protein